MRAVQAGDADLVACVAGDTNHVDTFRKTLTNFSRFAQDAVYPYGSGGANASFALITKNYMNLYGATREDFGKLCIAQRDLQGQKILVCAALAYQLQARKCEHGID